MKRLLSDLYEEIFSYSNVCEIRLNVGRPIWLQTKSKRIVLPRTVEQARIDKILEVACDYSVYTAVGKMVQGFLPYRGGVRIGVAGLYTLLGGALHSVSSVSALVIRLAHVVEGCSSLLALSSLADKSVLVISSPFGGKTTFLRDLACRLSAIYAVVVVDERDELAGCGSLRIGDCIVLRGSPKNLVHQGVVRALSPQYVVFDELMGEGDIEVVGEVKRSGICVVASYHSRDESSVPPRLLSMFDVVVTLSAYPHTGTIEGVRYA